MIKYNPKSWFGMILAFTKSDTLRILWKEILYVGLFSTGLAYVMINFLDDMDFFSHLMSVYSLIGFVISLLLVFRTNTGYDRWWEGRKKWGALVNDTRNLAIKIGSMTSDKDDRAFYQRMIPNFVFATKEHLRHGVQWEELELTEEERTLFEQREHIPNQVSLKMFERAQRLKAEGKITQEEYLALDKNLNALLDSLGACERIKNTPIPYSYSLFIKKFIFIYTFSIPLALIPTFEYYTALISCFIFYILVSMEILAEEIEDPFGRDDNDLPTDNLCMKIKANVAEILQ